MAAQPALLRSQAARVPQLPQLMLLPASSEQDNAQHAQHLHQHHSHQGHRHQQQYVYIPQYAQHQHPVPLVTTANGQLVPSTALTHHNLAASHNHHLHHHQTYGDHLADDDNDSGDNVSDGGASKQQAASRPHKRLRAKESIIEKKKESHKEVERRRRVLMSTYIDGIAKMLPPPTESKIAGRGVSLANGGLGRGKADILASAVEYIAALKEEVGILKQKEQNFDKERRKWVLEKVLTEADFQELRAQNEELKQENEMLRRHIVEAGISIEAAKPQEFVRTEETTNSADEPASVVPRSAEMVGEGLDFSRVPEEDAFFIGSPDRNLSLEASISGSTILTQAVDIDD